MPGQCDVKHIVSLLISLIIVQAFKAADEFVSSVMSVYQCRPLDPAMQQVWEYKAELHSAAQDEDGAASARKQALKCKSSMVRARSGHKSKQRKDTRGS